MHISVSEASETLKQWRESVLTEAMTRRNERLERLRTPQDVQAWARELRAWYRQQVGPIIGDGQGLRRECCGRIERDGYSVEKWLFESMPGTFCPANLYVPAKPNAAGIAVVAPLGHWPEGKAVIDEQNFSAYMAHNGIGVLVYDHFGVGEKREYWNPIRGESRCGKSPTSEHNRAGDLATLAGIQPSRFFLTEAARAREFLSTFDFVKPQRVGFSGASGGAMISVFAAAYLDDLAFVIPACILRAPAICVGGDAEQGCWGALVRGVSGVDLLAANLPRPAMLISENHTGGTAQSFAVLRHIYELAGANAAATDYFSVDDRHGYTHPMIEAAYRFLARNFDLPQADPDTWKHVQLLRPDQTQIATRGILNRERRQVTLQGQIKKNCPPAKGLTRQNLAQVLRIADLTRSPIPYTMTGEVGATVRVTGWLDAKPGELGLLDVKPSQAPAWYHGDDWLYREGEPDLARFLLHCDRCLVGLRVRQLLDFLEDHRGRIQTLEADGPWAIVAAFAAALAEPTLLSKAHVRYLPLRFRDWLDADLNSTSLGSVVPGLLAFGDMDDVLKIAGDRLQVTHRVDAEGRVVAE